MSDTLPPNLAALERELAEHLGVPPAGLRDRVLAAAGLELDSPRRPSRRWWVGAAAAALLWANLSMSVANHAEWRTAPEPDPAAASAVAAELSGLLPDLTEAETYRLVTHTWPVRWPAPGPIERSDPPTRSRRGATSMGHALIWVETLTATLAAVGLVTAWAARRSRRLVRWSVAGGFAAVLLGLAVAVAVFVARLPGGSAYQSWFAASWTAALAAGVVLVLTRGLWGASEAGGPAGRAWNLGRLAAVAGAAAVLNVMTVSNLDLSQKILLARERAEAGARVVPLLPPPVADRDNAAPVYREAFDALRPRDPASTKKLDKWLTRPDSIDPRSPEVTDYLRDREPGLALLRKAAAMPGCRFEMDYLQPLRQWAGSSTSILGAARLLAFDARVRTGRGEPGPALADVAALYGVARHIDEPALLPVLVAAALDSMAGEALADVVSRTTPTAADLALVRPGDVSHQRALRRAVEMERAAFGVPGLVSELEARDLGNVWWSAREVGLREAAAWWVVGTAAYRVFFLADDLAAHQEDTAAVLAQLARPYWEARADWEARDRAPGQGGLLAQSLRVPVGRYARDAAQVDARHRLARLALAAASSRVATGALPERADVLVPGFLPAVPADPFSGAPLRVRRDGKILILYSVGPDGRDDGGAARSDDVTMRVSDR